MAKEERRNRLNANDCRLGLAAQADTASRALPVPRGTSVAALRGRLSTARGGGDGRVWGIKTTMGFGRDWGLGVAGGRWLSEDP